MKYCKTCNLIYKDNQNECIFCKSTNLENIKDSPIDNSLSFPKYQKNTILPTMFKILFFILFIATMICGYIDFISQKDHHLSWSLVVGVSSAYSLIIFRIIYKEGNWIVKTLISIIMTILEVVLVGFSIGNYRWAIGYVLPFALIFNLLFLAVILIVIKKSWFDFAYYLIGICLLGVIPSILNLCKVTNVTWPSTACLFVSIAVFLGLFFLKGKSSIKELKRRFHI